MTDAIDVDDVDELPEETLHSFGVLARFRRDADSPAAAEAAVREELFAARGLYDDARVEPQDPDGRWPVDVRFVVASVDAERAVDGVAETLRGSGLAPDEVWVAERLP